MSAAKGGPVVAGERRPRLQLASLILQDWTIEYSGNLDTETKRLGIGLQRGAMVSDERQTKRL